MTRGKGWEARLETWHDEYRKHRRCAVWKTQPGVQAVGGGRAVFTGVGPPDYFGIVNGRFVAFDAKSTAKSVLYRTQVPAHQARDLEAVMEYGGFAFLAVRLCDEQYVVPWAAVSDEYWSGDAKTIRVAQVGIRFGAGGWLDAVLGALL